MGGKVKRGERAEAALAIMNKKEIIWAAGFFDGEGTIFVSHRTSHSSWRNGVKRRYEITSVGLSVGQSGRPDVLVRFQQALGIRKRIQGPFYRRKKNDPSQFYLPMYRLQFYGRPWVHRILVKLWPYLSPPKIEQAQKVWATLKAERKPKSPYLPALPLAPKRRYRSL